MLLPMQNLEHFRSFDGRKLNENVPAYRLLLRGFTTSANVSSALYVLRH